jgi:hypothetical protein
MTQNVETVTLKVQSVRLLIKVLHLLRQDHGTNIELAQGIEDLGKFMDICRECHDRLIEKTARQFLQALQAESGIDSALAFAYQERLRRPASAVEKALTAKVALYSQPPLITPVAEAKARPAATNAATELKESAPPEDNAITLVYRGRVIKKPKK